MTAGLGPVTPIRSDRLEALRSGTRPGAATTGDAAGFETLLQQASGGLVDELPTGPAAPSWGTWERPVGALGIFAAHSIASSRLSASRR